MRFVVNIENEVFVEDRFTRTRRPANSLMDAHREVNRLNETMLTHSVYETIEGFRPINPPSLASQIQFIANVVGHA